MDPNDVGAPDLTQQTNEPPANEGNPAWQELYGVLPDSLHSVARPVLEKWEQNNQQQIQKYAETTKQYEPYKDLIENHVPMDQIQQALSVAQLIDADPKAFMEQMQAFFGGDNAQPQQQQQQVNPEGETYSFDEQPFDLENDPRFAEMKRNQDIMANFLATQAQQEAQDAANKQLEADLSDLKTKYGDYDERYVVTLAASGMELEDAVKQYHELVNTVRQQPRPADNLPSILSPGGGTAVEQINPADMTTEQRKAFVRNALEQANRQG